MFQKLAWSLRMYTNWHEQCINAACEQCTSSVALHLCVFMSTAPPATLLDERTETVTLVSYWASVYRLSLNHLPRWAASSEIPLYVSVHCFASIKLWGPNSCTIPALWGHVVLEGPFSGHHSFCFSCVCWCGFPLLLIFFLQLKPQFARQPLHCFFNSRFSICVSICERGYFMHSVMSSRTDRLLVRRHTCQEKKARDSTSATWGTQQEKSNGVH